MDSHRDTERRAELALRWICAVATAAMLAISIVACWMRVYVLDAVMVAGGLLMLWLYSVIGQNGAKVVFCNKTTFKLVLLLLSIHALIGVMHCKI